MASNRQVSSARSRRDSIGSVGSMWEKLSDHLPRTRQDAPFANDDRDNDSADDEPLNDNHDGNTTDPDTPPTSSVPNTSVTSHVDQPSKSRQQGNNHEQLTIIINQSPNLDKTIKELKRDLARHGLQWAPDEEELSAYSFGLMALRIHFGKPQPIDMQMLCAAPSSIPFWLTFNKPKQLRIPTKDRSKQPTRLKLTNDFEITLQYGALNGLDQFRASPQHSWTNEKDPSWSMYLHDERCGGEYIEWIIESADVRRKKQLLVSNIHHNVVVDSREDGFDMYIYQRCNLSEFEAHARDKNNNNHHHNDRQQSDSNRPRSSSRDRGKKGTQYQRTNSRPRAPPSFHPTPHTSRQPHRIDYGYYRRTGTCAGSYFSTIRFGLQVNPFRSTNNNKRSTQLRINETLSLLTEYFLAQQITICYAKINPDMGPLPDLFFPSTMALLPSLIMKYSWQLLSIVGYGLQLRINDDFVQRLILLSLEENNADELFYRVCVYLSRMFSLKPFVDIVTELEHAVHESKKKRDAAAYGLVSKIDTHNENEAYIPSVTLTPTTIRVKPLKLCRTNRVLRACEKFGKSLYHFVLVDIRDENGRDLQAFHFSHLRSLLLDYLEEGFVLMDGRRQYKYLHHSQSQLRCRQFWFYHHHEKDDGFGNGRNVSFHEAYRWMGDFDREKNPAKYAARMALCFSTTRVSVTVPDKEVQYVPDIEINVNGQTLLFTDGCGTMSEKLRNKIKKRLHTRNDFSAVQFRYAGCKGVVSLDSRLQSDKHLYIRPSMNKFSSPHRMFEVCKLSAPRPVFLNRQAILLLDYRQISPVSFLLLQQRNQLQLIRALLRNDDAQALILEKIPQWFLPADIHLARIDYIREPFFRQLLIGACLQSIRDLLYRTRIRVPRNEGRNLMGIVDEYNVLKEGQVFIQYTLLDESRSSDSKLRILNNRQVVITKNPCHHPGDIRTFTAVDHQQLRHLKDVVVFSQQGERPAPHDISGSDLDGDEYLVLWHSDLVPIETSNAQPYTYDAHLQPTRNNPPVQPNTLTTQDDDPDRRKEINSKVLEIAEQDCLGRLSNLHLAFADKFGVADDHNHGNGVMSTVELAGAISQEVDSGKTGYHPLTEIEIKRLNAALENERPDYMDNANFDRHESKHILGQLYRASKRTLRGWNQLVQYHRHLRHLEVRTHHPSEDEVNEGQKDDHNDGSKAEKESEEAVVSPDPEFLTAVDRNHRDYHAISQWAGKLVSVYRQEMFEILNLYGLSHESDLWCRNSVNGLTGELEDTAYTELEQLVNRTRTRFFNEQVSFCVGNKCHDDTPVPELCSPCQKRQTAMSVACYCECYGDKHASEQTPILSLPWLFATPLLQHRLSQRLPSALPRGSLSDAMQRKLNKLLEKRRFRLTGLLIQFKTAKEPSVGEAFIAVDVCVFVEILQQHMQRRKHALWPKMLTCFVRTTSSFTLLSDGSEPSDEWQLALESRELNRNSDYLQALRSMVWSETEDKLMHEYFETLLQICFDEAQQRDNPAYLTISEDIMLLLQDMATNQMLR